MPFGKWASGLADKLNYGTVISDGVILTKCGSFVAGWFYRGIDAASATDQELNAHAERVNAALSRMGGGWAIWPIASRFETDVYPPPEASHFPDPISGMVDDERREQFEEPGAHFETELALLVMYTPPRRRYSRLAELLYAEAGQLRESFADRILERFQRDLATIEDALSSALTLRRMGALTLPDGAKSDELVNFINHCLTGRQLALRLRHGAFLDSVLGIFEFDHGTTPRHGDQLIATVRIKGFPDESLPQMLGSLDAIAIPYRYTLRFIALDTWEAGKAIDGYRKAWSQMIRGFIGPAMRSEKVNEHAATMARDAASALKHAQSGQTRYGYMTWSVVLMHENAEVLMERARAVVRAIQEKHGFAAEIDTLNTTDAWLGSLPAHVAYNIRRPIDNTDNLAHLMPLSSAWTGSKTHPNPLYPPGSPPLFVGETIGATPFFGSLSSHDVPHVLLLGPTGSGKSTMLAFLVLQARRYRGATIMALDKGRSLQTVAKACGGLHYDLAADNSPAICPLADLDTEADLAEAEDWLATCFELQMRREPMPGERDAVHKALVLMRDSPDRSLTLFCAAVQDVTVRDALRFYTEAMGRLFDATCEGIAAARLVVHEIGDLMALKDQVSVPFILHIFRKFRRQLKGQPAFLLIDEAWLALGNALTSDKIFQALKEFRKLCCGVVLATQSLSDVARSGLLDVLIENCPTKIYLANPEAWTTGTEQHPGPLDLYRAFGLNDNQVSIVENLIPKSELYITAPEGCAVVKTVLGPKALAFAGVSDPKDLARIAELERLYGDDWKYRWLNERTGRHAPDLRLAAE